VTDILIPEFQLTKRRRRPEELTARLAETRKPKPGRPKKYRTEEERRAANLASMKRSRDKRRGAPAGKPGRPKKYLTNNDRQTANVLANRRWLNKLWDAQRAIAVAAYERRWGTEFIPLSFPPLYKDGHGEMSTDDYVKGLMKNIEPI
jgi:hypothetical protein